MTATSIEMRDTVAASNAGHARADFEFIRGTLINRYVVLERLGAGGMSIVYAAYDPELRRRVALKLLLFDPDGVDQVRMLREARAIARLSHPNVITVFDVGTFEGRVYITMEYVDGETLRAWRASAPRSWAEVLTVFLAAAGGLSAAHAAGLVHRDFKPENVLIGKDGRVRVLDFGLARRAPSVARPDEATMARSFESVAIPGTDVFRIDISRVGSVVGTPAYMAPEQLARSNFDHRADQFSFCVALFEALFGHRPYQGQTTIELLTAISRGALEFRETRHTVPQRLTRVLVRGLAPDASQRFASMDELARALERARTPRRAGLWLGLGGVVVAAAGYGYFAVDPAQAQAPRCLDGERRVADVWHAERAAAIERSLAATGLAYARDTGPLVAAQLDRYAQSWRDAHAAVCGETGGAQAGPLVEARLDCLDERWTDLRTAVEIFADADAGVAEHAVQAASELRPPHRCTTAALRDEASGAGVDAAAMLAIRETLSRVRVENDAGRHARARELARAALARADEAGDAALRAEALLQLGFTELADEAVDAAVVTLTAALELADEAGHDGVRAAAATRLVRAVGVQQSREAEGMMWGRIAGAVIRRLGSPPDLAVELHANLAKVHFHFARYAEAVAEFDRAVALDSDATNYRVAAYHAALGDGYYRQRHYAQARVEYEAAIEGGSTSLGPEHPALARSMSYRGWTQLKQGHADLAELDFLRAVGIVKAAFGAEDVRLAVHLNALATVDLYEGDYAEAGRRYEEIRGLVARSAGESDLELLGATTNLAEVKFRGDAPARSQELGEQALRIAEATLGPDHDRVAHILAHLARAQTMQGDFAAAEQHLARAVELLERTQGASFPELSRPLIAQGLLALARERPGEAIAPLERTLALVRESWEPPAEYTELRLALAEALWASGGDRARARALVDEVTGRLAEVAGSAGHDRWLADAERWLAAHPAIQGAR